MQFSFKFFLLSLTLATIGSILSSEAKTSFFRGLGDLPGVYFSSEAVGLSANGTRVVAKGTPGESLSKAFIWDNTGKVEVLNDIDNFKKFANMNSPEDISADGTIVVGVETTVVTNEEYPKEKVEVFIWDKTRANARKFKY